MYSSTAHAMLNPSKVLVPLPISSIMSRLLEVALFKMFAISLISTMNVLWPVERLSDAPTRVKILSVMQILAAFAGTNDPKCAISVISATWRIYVLFPAMFGPVRMIKRSFCMFISVEFGTNASFMPGSTTGCLPSVIEILPLVLMRGRTYPFATAALANEQNASSSAITAELSLSALRQSESFSRISVNSLYSSWIQFSFAPRIFSSASLSCGVI